MVFDNHTRGRSSGSSSSRKGVGRSYQTLVVFGMGCLVVASLFTGALAVTCESFLTEAECNQTTTSSGKCGWVLTQDTSGEGGGVCSVTEELGQGMVGITAITGGVEQPSETSETGNQQEQQQDDDKEEEEEEEEVKSPDGENSAPQNMFLGTLVGVLALLHLCL